MTLRPVDPTKPADVTQAFQVTPDEYLVFRVARVCHEANRAYCLTLRDTSQPSWDDAPQWQRDSAEAGVRAILTGTVTSPSQSHESWMAQKLAEGWTWGPAKDPDNKLHPCLVPYDELPEAQRRKDALFFAIVTALTKEIP